ncbi:branched-chain amino acid ABC transporter permease [Geopsychrobacter electrodiphilus]|uniref:branched-chain amino acid ABC transporter permease n=1 Tax=Geopsychrobacter electrodiphilus TaxID=225196 RepID=UPI00036B3887|nr:branched-chain amino acid ABC transporter permease [Geopsychrobacter electrodiphilus]
MDTLLVILIDGLVYSSWLFIVAAGLTLVYGVMKILNMAHGSLYAIGAYSAASMVGWYFTAGYVPWASYLVFIGAAIVAGAFAGLLIERGLLRVMYGRDEVVMILVTYGVLLIMEDVIKLLWGVQAYYAYQPYTLVGRTKLLGITFANYDFLLIAAAVVIGTMLWAGLNRTIQGKLLKAVIHDREISMAMGINVKRTFFITFILGSALGALAGGLTAPSLSVVPGIGIEVGILAFAVVVIGGLGSVGGAAVGALMVGISRSIAVHTFPQVELFVIYGVMALVLVVRPQGLFVSTVARKI